MRKILPLLFLFIIQQLAAQNFTPGNLAVLQAASASANNTTANVLEINSSTAAQASPLRTIAIDGATIRVSGSGTSTLYGSNNNDGTLFSFTGHSSGTATGNANVLLSRAVVAIDNLGAVTLPATYTGATGNQTRSATSLNNADWFIADQGGVYSNSTTTASPAGNFRGIKAFSGVVYIGQQSAIAASVQVGTISAPTGGSFTALPGLTNNTSFQDFYLVSSANNASFDVLYVLSSTGAAAGSIAKYSLVGSTWMANGTYTTSFGGFGLAAKSTGTGAYLYATTGTGATAANSIIRLTDVAGYNTTINITTGSNVTLYTTPTGTTLKGVAFAPVASANNLALSFSAVAASAPLNPPAVSTVLNDATDALSVTGISVDVKDNGTAIATADYTVTAASSNTTVVPVANVVVTKADGQATIKITAAAVGYADVTLTLTKGSFTKTIVINVAASAASSTPANTKFHSGTSDASAAIAIDDNFMIVADDEMNKLFVYNRTTSGLPVTSFAYGSLLGLTDMSGGAPREVDVEAAVKSPLAANRIYWLGSMSNSATSFAARPNRNRLFAVIATGTGAATSFSYVGLYGNLKQDLVSWGDANGYDFTTSAAAGKDPKQIDGFNVEGLTFAPDNTTAYIAFRAPLVPTANRTKAVIAPVQNFDTWFNNGSPSGSPVIGAPIELDLGGRGFRDIVKLSNGTYVILAGNSDDTPLTPAVFTWNGSATSAPVMINSFTLTGLNPEGVMEVRLGGNLQGDRLQILNDNGDNIYYGDGVAAKDLSQNNFKKFRSDILISGSGSVLPLVLKSFTVQRQSNLSILNWEMATATNAVRFMIERSVNGQDFTTIGSVNAFANREAYQYEDAFNAGGKIYYRIMAVETSGKKTYSAIRVVNNASAELVSVYPNPSFNGVLTVTTTTDGLKFLSLIDASGRKAKEMSFTGSVTDISTATLAKGNYYLVVSTKEKIIATQAVSIQ